MDLGVVLVVAFLALACCDVQGAPAGNMNQSWRQLWSAGLGEITPMQMPRTTEQVLPVHALVL